MLFGKETDKKKKKNNRLVNIVNTNNKVVLYDTVAVKTGGTGKEVKQYRYIHLLMEQAWGGGGLVNTARAQKIIIITIYDGERDVDGDSNSIVLHSFGRLRTECVRAHLFLPPPRFDCDDGGSDAYFRTLTELASVVDKTIIFNNFKIIPVRCCPPVS